MEIDSLLSSSMLGGTEQAKQFNEIARKLDPMAIQISADNQKSKMIGEEIRSHVEQIAKMLKETGDIIRNSGK